MEENPFPDAKERNQLWNPTWNQKEAENDDCAECQKRRETMPGTLPGARRNQKEPQGTGNDDDDGTEWQETRETSHGTLTIAKTRRNQDMMIEQNAKRLGRQAPEPNPEPE